eukprot:Gb_04861 [translate_table: standard]
MVSSGRGGGQVGRKSSGGTDPGGTKAGEEGPQVEVAESVVHRCMEPHVGEIPCAGSVTLKVEPRAGVALDRKGPTRVVSPAWGLELVGKGPERAVETSRRVAQVANPARTKLLTKGARTGEESSIELAQEQPQVPTT